jgi:lactate dehydrogenase-like 2-hydroxyacid dehydrogenase
MEDRPRVVVSRRPPGNALERIRAVADVWLWEEDTVVPREVLLSRLEDADGYFSMLTESVDAELLDAAPGLRVVSNMAVGVDNVDLDACTRRSVAVGHTPGVLTETTADTAFGLLLMAARRLVEGVKYVEEGRWTRWEPGLLWGNDVHSSTLGIVGLGRIGRAVARRGAGFGMRLLYHSRSRHPDAEAEIGLVYREFDDLLAESDHVVVAVALTEATHHLIDRRALGIMKPTATLVNISRGATVDPAALADALRSGAIGAAGLDVTEPEPIPPDDPLLALPNCVVIPHLGSSSRATREAMAALAVDNLLAGLAGDRLPACANPEVYE